MPKAPRYCPAPGCRTLITHSKTCPEHKPEAWAGERTASSRVTSQRSWKAFARTILERDRYQCQIRTPGICIGHASEVDKIIPAAKRPELAMVPTNARAACRPCNQRKAIEDRQLNNPRTAAADPCG